MFDLGKIFKNQKSTVLQIIQLFCSWFIEYIILLILNKIDA